MWVRTMGFGVMAGLLAFEGGPAKAEQIKPLLQQPLADASIRTFTAAEVDFAPRERATPHRHGQAFVYAYVIAGAVRSQLEGGSATTFRAGQGWIEPPGAHHVLTQNPSRTRAARLLVVFVGPAGQPLKIPDHPEERRMGNSAGSGSARQPAPQQMNDALYAAFGDHHSRAVHAKGVLAEGTFEPTAEAAGLSKASIFANGTLPVRVRFSDFTGIPEIPDTAGEANPRGFALKIVLPDGSSADVVSHSFNGFPTATSAEFRELLLALAASGPAAAKPTALDRFLAGHPTAKTFLTTQKPPPASYATLSYFGVNTFAFTAANGARRFIRYRFVPEGGEEVLSAPDLAGKGPDYLQTELPARLKAAPIAFTWLAQIAETPDRLDDPSIPWPENRRLVKLGTVRIDRMAPDQTTVDKVTAFQPLNVPAGIDPADPMLVVRQGAYPLSFAHRQ